MELFSWLVLSLHYGLLLILCLFGLHRLSMVWRARRHRQHQNRTHYLPTQQFDELPLVTIQIPVFNERNVAVRIIDHAVKMQYPADKLQIQVVDDSTDETVDAIANCVTQWQAQGVNIDHVHRTNRQGFKAGALRDAMTVADGEFIAIFDADFMPETDFLMQTIHHFTDQEVAMVQGRWGHLNLNSNRLTKTQAIMLDSHFALEQQVRFQSDMLFNFNGTAGIWRTEAIIDAGHWSADTLTEDLDLSYRAQLKGWKLVYRNDIVCPAELPADMRAFKSQQHRWAKGGIQVMKKLLATVWKTNYSLAKKLESTFHLSNNFAYFVMLVDTLLLLVPSLIAREYLQIPFIFLNALFHLPFLLLLGICLAFNNARAALEALMNQESEFVRTPKSGEIENAQAIKPVKTYRASLPASEGIELAAGLIFLYGVLWSVQNQSWLMLPFFLLLALGFSLSAWTSLQARIRG